MNLDHILFPTDFSEHSRALNKQVEWLAARFGSRVTLLHVVEVPVIWYAASEGVYLNMECVTSLLDGAKQRLNAYNLDIPADRLQRVVEQGDAAGCIANWAAENAVDLIVMGTHGYGKLGGLLLGSVAAKVMHDVSCPVWTNSMLNANASDAQVVSGIVCALEMTDEAIPLLRFTQQLASSCGAKVLVVHSVPEAETRPNKYFDVDLHQCLVESARQEIAKLQHAAGTNFPLVISGERISGAVSSAAREHEASLIVIGRGKAQKAFGQFRTHASQIIHEAPCAVLSYSLSPQDRISSSCSEEHLAQSSANEQLLIGSRTL